LADIKGQLSVGESHNECQCDVETSDIALIEAAYELPDPTSSNRYRFVGHYLGADPQTVSPGWVNGDPEIRGIHDSDVIWQITTDACVCGSASVWTMTAGRGFP
jgi:hypothetical protein